jgi:Na+-transporting methylmalonyl-CoA/oxaloacetate decarboxylase gamma subunit
MRCFSNSISHLNPNPIGQERKQPKEPPERRQNFVATTVAIALASHETIDVVKD